MNRKKEYQERILIVNGHEFGICWLYLDLARHGNRNIAFIASEMD